MWNGLLIVFQDLSKLGRDLKHVLIVDNSPASYSFHPENAVSDYIRLAIYFMWHSAKYFVLPYLNFRPKKL